MKKIITLMVLASLALTSCKKEETAEAPPADETATDTTAVATDTTATTTAAQQAQPAVGPNGSVMTAQQAVANSYNAPAPPPTAKGMNPPHGQPGHRCDIAVGAPLNSPPGKKAATNGAATVTKATTVTPAMLGQTVSVPSSSDTPPATIARPAEPVVTAPGMNPPHGQEGHVCSVAVGAPLPKKE